MSGEHALDTVESKACALPEFCRERGQVVLVTDAIEKFVVEVSSEASQCCRQRGLTQAQLLRCSGHAHLLQKGIERDQQVEVEVRDADDLPHRSSIVRQRCPRTDTTIPLPPLRGGEARSPDEGARRGEPELDQRLGGTGSGNDSYGQRRPERAGPTC